MDIWLRKKEKTDPAQPAFKPRAVKKSDNYRDRASERRQGTGNDYAQVRNLIPSRLFDLLMSCIG